jgi:hypothetical protein
VLLQPGCSEFGGLGCVDWNVLRAIIVGVLATWLGSQRFCVHVSPPCHLVLGDFFSVLFDAKMVWQVGVLDY